MQETQVLLLDWEDPLEEERATRSSILAWRIPWTDEPGGLQSMGSQSRTQLSTHARMLVGSRSLGTEPASSAVLVQSSPLDRQEVPPPPRRANRKSSGLESVPKAPSTSCGAG